MDTPALVRAHHPLADYTSWQIGGPADFFAEPQSIEDFQMLRQWAQALAIPIQVLGGGSNVLISDQGVEGLVIGMRRFNAYQVDTIEGQLQIVAQPGMRKSELLKIFLKHRLAPALFLAGLPGDVGGGVVMNAGVSEKVVPQEFGELVAEVQVLRPEGTLEIKTSKDLQWTYRHSEGWQPGWIVGVTIRWPQQPQDDILSLVKSANQVRLTKQPLDLPSCGSVFKNPPGQKAAQLIDSCGLKGYTQGQAQVSLKHANFIVNLGGASAQETWGVIQYVQDQVFQKCGVKLHTEVVRFGRW